MSRTVKTYIIKNNLVDITEFIAFEELFVSLKHVLTTRQFICTFLYDFFISI